MATSLARRLFTVDEYYRMGEIGVLPMESSEVELLAGEVYLRWSNDARPSGSRRLFTVEEYERLAEAGILHEDEHVELIEGEIVEMVPIGSHHSGTVKRLNALLMRRFGSVAVIGVQDPVRIGSLSEPEPDISVLKARADFYTSRNPSAEDVLLLIEVSDSSLKIDPSIKLPIYASAAIPEVWLVDLTSDAIEVFSEPPGSSYTKMRVARRGESIAPLAFPDLMIVLNDILG
ncbi:MAG TPA: Uma2 family endonuclease [Dehalococcoidia bacterium]|nr:Uma2 family endonuclease [Dehalococcoidia bacterium]